MMLGVDATMCRINVLLANCGRLFAFELEDLFRSMFYLIYL